MPEIFASRQVIKDLFTDALKEMDWDRAVLDVAGRTGQSPAIVEGVVQSRESAHSAAMGEGV